MNSAEIKTVALVKDKDQHYLSYEKELKKHHINLDLIDIWSKPEQDRLLSNHYDAFIWRAKHNPQIKNLARRYIYLFDQVVKVPTYPGWRSYWHYDDKISQYYLFQTHQIPTIPTYIFFRRDEAMEFVEHADYPLIYKCPHGAGSSNVGLLKSRHQARRYVNKIFGRGVRTYFKSEIQRGYVYLQDFLPGNEGDYRIYCFSNVLAFGIFRRNRKDDPFASGSDLIEYIDIPEQILDVAMNANQKMEFDIMSYDLLLNRDNQWVISEISCIFRDRKIKYNYYLKQDNHWQKRQMQDSISEMAISHILKNVWKWI